METFLRVEVLTNHQRKATKIRGVEYKLIALSYTCAYVDESQTVESTIRHVYLPIRSSCVNGRK